MAGNDGTRARRARYALGMAALLLLPTVVLFGMQRVEERYRFRDDATAVLPAAESLGAPGRFGVEVRASGEMGFVVEYRALGLAWLVRLSKRGLGVPDTYMEGFRTSLDPVWSLPAVAGLLILSWVLAGSLARR